MAQRTFIFRKEAPPADPEYADWKVWGVFIRATDERIGYLLNTAQRNWMAFWGPTYFNDYDPRQPPPPNQYVGWDHHRETAAEKILEFHKQET